MGNGKDVLLHCRLNDHLLLFILGLFFGKLDLETGGLGNTRYIGFEQEGILHHQTKR